MKTLKNITPIDAIVVLFGAFTAFAIAMAVYNYFTIGVHFSF